MRVLAAVILCLAVSASATPMFAVEQEFQADTFMISGKDAKQIVGDDGLNVESITGAKGTKWIASMDDPKGTRAIPDPVLNELKKKPGLSAFDNTPVKDATGLLEIKTDGVLALTKENLFKHLEDRLELLNALKATCGTDNFKAYTYSKALDKRSVDRTDPNFYDTHKAQMIAAPKCDQADTIKARLVPNEIQMTFDWYLDTLATATNVYITAARKSMEGAGSAPAMKEFTKDYGYAADTKCGKELKGMKLLLQWWIWKSGEQKQSINPLPKIHLGALYNNWKTECASAADLFKDVYEHYKKTKSGLKEPDDKTTMEYRTAKDRGDYTPSYREGQDYQEDKLYMLKACTYELMTKYYDEDKKKDVNVDVTENGAESFWCDYNGHAGHFKIKPGARTAIAIEVRKAQDVPGAKFVQLAQLESLAGKSAEDLASDAEGFETTGAPVAQLEQVVEKGPVLFDARRCPAECRMDSPDDSKGIPCNMNFSGPFVKGGSGSKKDACMVHLKKGKAMTDWSCVGGEVACTESFAQVIANAV